jgi:hypothetical protein
MNDSSSHSPDDIRIHDDALRSAVLQVFERIETESLNRRLSRLERVWDELFRSETDSTFGTADIQIAFEVIQLWGYADGAPSEMRAAVARLTPQQVLFLAAYSARRNFVREVQDGSQWPEAIDPGSRSELRRLVAESLI